MDRKDVAVIENKWIYLLRQLMISSGVWTTFFMIGQFLGAPTVFVPQLRKDSAVILNDDMSSWLYSVFGFAAAPWVIFLSALTKRYGLRIPYAIGCVDLLLAYLILYFSTTPTQILISQIVFGIGYASALTIGIVVISEYTSPEYRGIFLTCKAASLFWGLWSANAIGTFFHWKSIAYPGIVCSIYTFSVVFWPESPRWLASEGKFDECRKAHYWLQGYGEKSKNEVEKLIASQAGISKSKNHRINIYTAIRTVKSKEFFAPFLLTVLLITQYHFSGKFVCVIYIIDILKKMTKNETTAYMGMLVLDGVTLLSMYFGCFLSKILRRRTLYLTSSIIGIAFLFIISLYLYLVSLSVVKENQLLSMVLLAGYSIAMGCGPMILNVSIYAELIPLKFRSAMITFGAVLFYIYLTMMLKIAPFIFKSLCMHGSFLSYAIISGICTVLLYKYLPETKDKTLQEIEGYFKTHKGFETERLKSQC